MLIKPFEVSPSAVGHFPVSSRTGGVSVGISSMARPRPGASSRPKPQGPAGRLSDDGLIDWLLMKTHWNPLTFENLETSRMMLQFSHDFWSIYKDQCVVCWLSKGGLMGITPWHTVTRLFVNQRDKDLQTSAKSAKIRLCIPPQGSSRNGWLHWLQPISGDALARSVWSDSKVQSYDFEIVNQFERSMFALRYLQVCIMHALKAVSWPLHCSPILKRQIAIECFAYMCVYIYIYMYLYIHIYLYNIYTIYIYIWIVQAMQFGRDMPTMANKNWWMYCWRFRSLLRKKTWKKQQIQSARKRHVFPWCFFLLLWFVFLNLIILSLTWVFNFRCFQMSNECMPLDNRGLS